MKYKQHYHVSSHPFLSDINFAIMRSHDAQLIICFKNLTANVQTALQRTVPAKGKINNKKKLKKKNKQNKNIKMRTNNFLCFCTGMQLHLRNK